MGEIIREKIFKRKKKKPGVKFNPVLALIGVRKTGPWRFQTWPLRNYVIITQIRTQIKSFLKMRFKFTYSFGIETYTPIVLSKTIPDFRPKWAKSIPVFRPKRGKNPTLWGGTYLYGFYKGYSPPGAQLAPAI